MKKKDRQMIVEFNVYKDTKITINDGSKNIAVMDIKGLNSSDRKNSADITLLHKKEKGGNKITTRYYSETPNISIVPEDVIGEFDYIFVIDTNTKLVENVRCCAAVIGWLLYHNEKIVLKKFMHILFEIDVEDKNFEKYSWQKFIEELMKQELGDCKIGLIVDAYLGDIKSFNEGVEILDNFRLPSNITLMYASADKKNDSVLNWAISQCDKGATELLKSYEKDRTL